MTARELFQQAKEAERRVKTIRKEAEALNDLRSHRVGFGCAVSLGHTADPTSSDALAHMNSAKRMAAELRELAPVIDEASALCRGVSAGLGEKYGRVLVLRFLRGMLWKDVAKELGVSRETARAWSYIALDWVDSVGFARARAGVGTASQ